MIAGGTKKVYLFPANQNIFRIGTYSRVCVCTYMDVDVCVFLVCVYVDIWENKHNFDIKPLLLDHITSPYSCKVWVHSMMSPSMFSAAV